MRAPVSWIREYADLPATTSASELADRLTMLGLKLEALETPADQITGPLVVGRVLAKTPEPQKNGKVINWCAVDVGAELNARHGSTEDGVGIVCGAHNFDVGDLVVVVLPGGVLPGGFAISARKTYGHVSTGMICSARELGLGEDHEGIIVLPGDAGAPGEEAFDALGMHDSVLELEVNPDRAYALSVRGIAREAALGHGVEFHDPADRPLPAPGEGYPVAVEDPEGCPVFVTREVQGVDPGAPTPEWLVRRLTQAGMRPISLAVDVTNYVMLELGQPLHAYDRARLAGPIRVRRARAGEQLTTLDDVRRELDPADLLITDDSGPIGIAGVMGGESTEVGPETSDVVIEAACFEPTTVFRTQRRHRLPSEASKRFERGVDPELAPYAADRAAHLLAELGGGTVPATATSVGSAPARGRISIDAGLPARVTGMDIDAATTVSHLEAVGCQVTEDGGDGLDVEVPPWRPDLTDPFDLVEEVARVVGYDRVPSVLPPAPPGRGLSRSQRLRRRTGFLLAGQGLTEVISFPFVGSADLDALRIPADDRRRSTLRVENPLSAEQPYLATTLLPGLLGALGRNVGRGNTDVGLFETSHVFRGEEGRRAPILPVDRRPTDAEWTAIEQAVPEQPLHLAVALTGRRDRAGWWGEGREASWADAIAVVRDLAADLGVDVAVRNVEVAPWHPGRCAEVRAAGGSGAVLGHAGELHPRVCRDLGLPERSAAAEIDLDALLALAVEPSGPEFSAYPVAKEDVALVVDDRIPVAEVEAALRAGAGELLESVRLFDVYHGDQVGEGRKSLAFALRFRAPDRTLQEGEAAAAREAAVAAATEATGATQRA